MMLRLHAALFVWRCLRVPCPECGAVRGERCNAEWFGDWVGFGEFTSAHLARALAGGAVRAA